MAEAARSTGLVVTSSRAADPVVAVGEVAAAVAGCELAGGILFCSHRFPREALAIELTRQLGRFPLIGCTSAGELSERGYDEDSLVFVGFPATDFAMAVHAIVDLDTFSVEDGRQTVRRFSAEAVRSARRLGPEVHHAALFLVDGLSHREEILTMTLQEALGETVMVGGSSGDGMLFSETGVLVDGQFHQDAAVVAILSSPRPLHVFCTHHYLAGDERMVVTAADPQARTVFEINALPAAEEYARVAGHPGSHLDAAFFAAHPPMVRAGGQFHVRSIQTANPDGSLTFYGAIDNGIVLRVGQSRDRLAHIEELFGEVERQVGAIDHVIGFDCVLNRIDAENRQIARDVSRLYARNRVIGFNTYGEQFRAAHINQTLAGLAIGC